MKFALIFILIMTSTWGFANEVTIYCNDNSNPTNFTDENGKMTGLTYDFVKAIQKEIGDTSTIQTSPWKRIYSYALEKPNIVIFTASRNEDREKKFHWISQVTTRRSDFFAKKGSPVKVSSIDDAKKLSVGTWIESNREKLLQTKGFKNLQSVSSEIHNIKKLMAGRIDLIFMSALEAASNAKDAGFKFNDLESKFTVFSNDSYILMSKNGTSMATVKKWQDAAKKLKDNGTFDKISKKWIGYVEKQYGVATEAKNGVFYFWKD